MNKALALSLAALALTAAPAHARIMGMQTGGTVTIGGCTMTENANININFNGVEQDVTAVQAKFDARIKEIEGLVKSANLDKFEMQSMNYSINPQNYNGSSGAYNFNGNMSYSVLPASKATEVMADLIKKGYQASLNVNAFRNGNVPCNSASGTPAGAVPGVIQSE